MALPGVQEESGFFNAQELSEGVYDREYDASQFAEYFSNFISNGVYINPANQLKVEFVSERTVKVKSGKAFLLGYWYKLKEDATVTIPPNSTSGDIVTSICITYDKISRQANLTVRENVGSALPRNDDRYFDLVIWTVTIKPATSVLSPSLMQDRRPDKKYCGYVAAVVTDIDTTDLFKQFTDAFNEWFDNEKEAIEQAINNTMINDDTPSNVTTYSSEKIENIKLGLKSGDVKENVVTFEDAQSRENISSGETLGTIFGKIKKFFADLKTVAFTGKYSDLTGLPSSLPANGGNADTVGGRNLSYLLNYNNHTNKPTLGTAASRNVANNFTTNADGYVADARTAKVLNDLIANALGGAKIMSGAVRINVGSSATVDATVYFNKFTQKPRVVALPDSNWADALNVTAYDITSSSCKIRLRNTASAGANVDVMWIAIGT